MSGVTLSDDEIAALSRTERRDLIERLQRPVGALVPTHLGTVRRVRLGIMIVGALALIPWILYLSFTLPMQYTAYNWKLTWVGFDGLLALLMGLTALCGWRRRQLVMPLSFATGVLLLCDAWFDVMTAAPAERAASVASAGVLELPLAFVMIAGSLRLLRLFALRSYHLDEGDRLWSLRFPAQWLRELDAR